MPSSAPWARGRSSSGVPGVPGETTADTGGDGDSAVSSLCFPGKDDGGGVCSSGASGVFGEGVARRKTCWRGSALIRVRNQDDGFAYSSSLGAPWTNPSSEQWAE